MQTELHFRCRRIQTPIKCVLNSLKCSSKEVERNSFRWTVIGLSLLNNLARKLKNVALILNEYMINFCSRPCKGNAELHALATGPQIAGKPILLAWVLDENVAPNHHMIH